MVIPWGVARQMETHVASEATTIAKGGGLADRYAAALYAHADDVGALDTVVSEMESLGQMIQQSADFRRLIGSPLIDVTTGTKAALAVLEHEGYSKPVRDFVGVVLVQPASERAAGNHRPRSPTWSPTGAASSPRTWPTARPLNDLRRQQLRARLIEAGLR